MQKGATFNDNCPEYVIQAKKIRAKLISKADTSTDSTGDEKNHPLNKSKRRKR